MTRRVLIIGLDGVSFKTIIHGIESGRLPVMSSLVREGQATRMQSHYLPHTPESIGCFITGKNPGKTGLFGWCRYPNGIPTLISSQDCGVPFWEYLDRPVAIVGLPLTYPARALNGALIGSAHFSPSLKGFSYPEEMTKRAEKYGYVPMETDSQRTSDIIRATTSNIYAQEELSADILSSADWNLGIVYFQQTDIISHILGMVSSAVTDQSFRAMISDLLGHVDRWLGQVLKRFESKVDVIVFSDHGGGTSHESIVNANEIIRQAGLPLSRRTQEPENIFGMDKIDTSVTGLLVSEQADVRIGIRLLGPGREDQSLSWSVRGKLEEAFLSLRDSNGGSPVRSVSSPDQVYSGEKLDEAPSLLVQFSSGWVHKSDLDCSYMRRRSFGHEIDGFMLAHLSETSLPSGIFAQTCHCTYDLAATILALFDVGIPNEFDGQPFAAVEESSHQVRPAKSNDRGREQPSEKRELTKEEEETIHRRLKQLGYL